MTIRTGMQWVSTMSMWRERSRGFQTTPRAAVSWRAEFRGGEAGRSKSPPARLTTPIRSGVIHRGWFPCRAVTRLALRSSHRTRTGRYGGIGSPTGRSTGCASRPGLDLQLAKSPSIWRATRWPRPTLLPPHRIWIRTRSPTGTRSSSTERSATARIRIRMGTE